MKKYFTIILALILALSCIAAFAQSGDEDNPDNTFYPQNEPAQQQPVQAPGVGTPVQQQLGTVIGIVVCPNEKDESKLDPVAQAQISVENYPYNTISSKDGSFVLLNLPYGNYKIIAEKSGYYRDEKLITLGTPSVSITMTVSSTKEKTVKTAPGKNITGGGSSATTVFVAYASPASSETGQKVAPMAGSLDNLNPTTAMKLEEAIAAGADPRAFGAGYRPKYPHPYDPMTPQSMYENSIMLFDPKMPMKTTYVNLSSQPYWLVYNPETKLLYLALNGNILAYDQGSNKIVASFPVNEQIVTDMCLAKGGSLLYVATMGKKHAIRALDCHKNKFVKEIILPMKPGGIAVSPDGNTVYCSMGSGPNSVIYAFDSSGGSKKGEVKELNNPKGLWVSPDGKKLFAANYNSNSVSAIDTAKLSVITNISTGISPYKMAGTPDGKKLYVTCQKSDCVTVINADTDAAIKNIQVGKSPAGLAVTSDGGKVYVANTNSKTLSIIDAKTDTVTQSTVAQPRSCPWGVAVK